MRLGLEELESTSIEDYCINNGSYMIVLRYEDVVSIRRTLAGLTPAISEGKANDCLRE